MLMGAVMVVDVPVNCSGKLQVAYCAESRQVSQAQFWCSLLALRLVRQWTRDMRLVLVAFGRALTLFYVQMGPQFLKSILTCSPASRGKAKCAQSLLQSRGNLDTFS